MKNERPWEADFHSYWDASFDRDAMTNEREYAEMISFIHSTITSALQQEKRKQNEEIERVAQFAYERLAFFDYPHCETVYANTDGVHEVIKRIRALSTLETKDK